MINEWWLGDGRERLWMEITDREETGVNLLAPKTDNAGREYWSYSLVRHVRPGDFVLHWRKQHGPGITSYSRVLQEADDDEIEWQAHGTYGRKRGKSAKPAWLAPLGGHRDLKARVDQFRLRELEHVVRKAREKVEAKVNGPIYFPFALSNSRPVRTAQGYLVKFPYDLARRIPELREVLDLAASEPAAVDEPELGRGSDVKPTGTKTGRMNDVLKRRAIELYAVERAIALYESEGYSAEHVGDRFRTPWDLTVESSSESFFVEVKGSTGPRLTIDLTEGEVRHAEDYERTDLVVVNRIEVVDGNGIYSCSGGTLRRWKHWCPERSDLTPTAYTCPLPDGGEIL